MRFYQTARPFISIIILTNEQHNLLLRSGKAIFNNNCHVPGSMFQDKGWMIGDPTFSDEEFDQLLRTGDVAVRNFITARPATEQDKLILKASLHQIHEEVRAIMKGQRVIDKEAKARKARAKPKL